MGKKKGQKNTKPLFYIVQPDILGNPTNMQSEFRGRSLPPAKRKEGLVVDAQDEQSLSDAVEIILAMKEELETAKNKQNEKRKPKQTGKPEAKTGTELIAEEETPIPIERETELEETESMDPTTHENYYIHLKREISRLAKYPASVPKPTCEAEINGELVRFQVVGKRNDTVKIKIRNKERRVNIADMKYFRFFEDDK